MGVDVVHNKPTKSKCISQIYPVEKVFLKNSASKPCLMNVFYRIMLRSLSSLEKVIYMDGRTDHYELHFGYDLSKTAVVIYIPFQSEPKFCRKHVELLSKLPLNDLYSNKEQY